MTTPGQGSSRPEEATARDVARSPSASPTQARSQAALGLVFGVGAVVFWAATVIAEGAGTWALLALALLSTWMFVRYFTQGARRGALGTRRYWELVLRGWRNRA
ncbi:MAG: hypothetical protein FWE35_10565 [Streptosporangiales bacterium]|jgi:hypothetical protein|nr:hypothetical protein [Streptosporangiales bacterium]